MRSRRYGLRLTVFLIVAITGSIGCGADDAGPVAPTTETTSAVGARTDAEVAQQSAESWLELLDAGDFPTAYDRTGSIFQESVTAGEFRNRMEERLALLGAFESRMLDSTVRLTTAPGLPTGDYLVFEFDGIYELRPDARERITVASESGEWPVIGIYLIR